MKIKVTVRLNKIEPGSFLHRHEFVTYDIEAERHSEILQKAFTQVLQTENLDEVFGLDIKVYGQDEEVTEDVELTTDDIKDMMR